MASPQANQSLPRQSKPRWGFDGVENIDGQIFYTPPMPAKKVVKIEDAVREKLKLVLDPELGVSIVDLGLIYGISVSKDHICLITMTLTTIGCPLFAQIQKEIEDRVMEIEEIEDIKIDLTFDPPWSVDMMTEDARIQLGLD